jgi:Tfp pilus assembly protein PilX
MKLVMRRTSAMWQQSSGFTLPTVVSFMVVMAILSASVVVVIANNTSIVGGNVQSQSAFDIAESGLNYYLWHLAHNATDYRDGKSTPVTPDPQLGFGPYVHDYFDSNAVKRGTYTLWIKPQGSGSTIVTVRSIGKTTDGKVRTLEAQIGATSFASYGLVADVEFWFGSNETADGPVFSNQGIHMDGPSTDTVESANASYVPQPQYGGNGSTKDGVWCSSSVTTPVNCVTRDKSNWLFPRPTIDFNQVMSALCTMKKVAFTNDNATSAFANQASACNLTPAARTPAYIPRYSTTSFSSRRGYMIQLNANNTYDLYRVSDEDDTQTSYTAALTRTLVQSGIGIPSEGVIFVEDNVWVRTSSTFGGRVSIAAGRLGTNSFAADINIIDDLVYSTKSGADAIGLIAENDVLITPYAPPTSGAFTFEVNAAVLAQGGSVTYPDRYKVNSSRCTRGWVAPNQTFTFYGSVATRQYWTWNYTRSGGCGDAVYDNTINRYISGIKTTVTTYDYNLRYAPPPSYPVTSGYDFLNWREVLTRP